MLSRATMFRCSRKAGMRGMIRAVRNSWRNYADEAAPQPSTPKKSGGGKTILKLLGLTTVSMGGVVAYAWYDNDFRKQVEDNIPYSREALSYIYDSIPSSGIDMPSFPKKVPATREPKVEVINKKDRVANEAVNPVEKTQKNVTEQVETVKESAPVSVQPPLPSKQELERKIADKTATDALENAAMEDLARELMSACEELSNEAKKRHIAAVEAVEMHKEQVKQAMKTGIEGNEWETVSRALDHKKMAVQEAVKVADQARHELDKLRNLLTTSRENESTRKNPIIIQAQSKLNQWNYSLDSANSERQAAESSLTQLSEFKKLVDQGKKQFKKELDSIVPDASLGYKGQLSKDELNALIAHAHRRIEQLQVRLAEQAALEAERFGVALAKQREEDDELTKKVVEQELARVREGDALERQKWEAGVLAEAESRLRQELSRQSAAHNDHLSDVLRVQRRELDQQCREELREAILQERVSSNNEINDSMAKLRGIETAIEARAQMERTGRKAQELWLACQTLARSLTSNGEVILKNEVEAIKEAGNEHPFVNAIIESIPTEAVTSGLQTESTLVERFKKVKKICRRVAIVDETNGSLLKYFLSLIQSALIFDRQTVLNLDDEVPSDTFSILSQAEKYINEGDLELAVKFMRRLNGQARIVASDWLRDSITLMETKQAADLLLGHASACGLGSLLSSLSEEPKCH